MILLHGATPTGAERIAASWARDRGVPQKPYKPDWNRHKKAAPFKRNDAMLDDMPKGVIIFPGTGIQDNLADKARKMGIRIWDFRERCGRSEEHTSELQSLMRNSYAVFCLKKKQTNEKRSQKHTEI